VEKNLVGLDKETGIITFQAKKGKSLDVDKIYESFLSTSLYGPNGIENVNYLEITALGEVAASAEGTHLRVAGTAPRFRLGDDPDHKPQAGEQTALRRLQQALARGTKVTGVTGRVHGFNAPLSAKDPDQRAGKKPLLLIVTDFRTAKK
jgi:hypothetical protein